MKWVNLKNLTLTLNHCMYQVNASGVFLRDLKLRGLRETLCALRVKNLKYAVGILLTSYIKNEWS